MPVRPATSAYLTFFFGFPDGEIGACVLQISHGGQVGQSEQNADADAGVIVPVPDGGVPVAVTWSLKVSRVASGPVGTVFGV